MRRPKFSIRWLMAAVLLVALGLGLGPPAWQAYANPEVHHHGYVGMYEGQPTLQWESSISPTFWQRYWSRLARLPWGQKVACRYGSGLLEETCELDHPEIVGDLICRGPALNPTPAMMATYKRLQAEHAASSARTPPDSLRR
jgi:hypothetical protein